MGLSVGMRANPFGVTAAVLMEIVFGAMNMIGGIVLLSYYAGSAQQGLIFPETLQQISLLLFVFGILSFLVAMLGAVPILSNQSRPYTIAIEQPSTIDQPQVSTRQYVTKFRTVTLEQSAEREKQSEMPFVCQNCGREASSGDDFCVRCGSPLQHVPGLSPTVAPE